MANYLKIFGSRVVAFYHKYPVVRGMVSYGALWPTSCYIQQRIEGKTWENIDWKRCTHYSMYGFLIAAPSLYQWVKLTTIIWPQNTLKIAALKAVVEQIVYEPIFLYLFFIVMCLLEGKSFAEARDETSVKFWPTYLISSCFWPMFQTINFAYVPERNRVLVVSFASLVWITFLAYMKHYRELAKLENPPQEKSKKQ